MNFYTSFSYAFGLKLKKFFFFHSRKKEQSIRYRKFSFLLLLLLLGTIVQAGAYAQSITLQANKTPLKKVLQHIEEQSGMDFWFQKDQLNENTPVTFNVKKTDLNGVLLKCFENLPYTYEIIDKTIFIKPKVKSLVNRITDYFKGVKISGQVTDADGKPVAGATVTEIKSRLLTQTNADGNFTLQTQENTGVISVSYLGYLSENINFTESRNGPFTIALKLADHKLDEVQIIGYGETTRRLNTGSISSVNAKDIEKQPVTNLQSALSGRMAGVYVQTTNGLPGGGISIQIRGKGSITAGTDPLYIIDGVPYPAASLVNNTSLGDGINGAINPLNSINPGDIESIDVLKDADATAIYGSRAANGVVLITTKKGKSGQTKTTVDFNQGMATVASMPRLLGLEDYLSIRKEAYKNDNRVPSADPASSNYAPDLLKWSQTESTDWAKYYMGGTANSSNVNASISGGASNTSFLVSGNYRSEGSVLRGTNHYQRGGTQLSLQSHSVNQKFNLSAHLSYTIDDNLLSSPARSFVTTILLPPNYPIYESNGAYNWDKTNPDASLLAYSKIKTQNLISNTQISYQVLENLRFKTNIGLNRLNLDQVLVTPKSSLNPSEGIPSFSYFGDNSNASILVEPQFDYQLDFKNLKISLLGGATWQQSNKNSENLYATNFSSENLLENPGAATTVTPNYNNTVYKYVSVFSRITFNLKNKYLLNLSGRRDGSSRFGANNQFGNFGAIGAAWILTEENWMKNQLGWLSFAKLRSSYGITGNDQISDYQYLSTYSSSGYLYQSSAGLTPSRIANDDFKWEANKKFEIALEAGFLKDRLTLNVNYFNNQSGNQLVNYSLPYLTGFLSYQANLPAKILNSGWEFSVASTNIQNKVFSWKSNFNFTLNRNILKYFPGIETSSYNNTLKVGESILRTYGYSLAGIDPATGIASYNLRTGGTSATPAFDNLFMTTGDRNPRFYGGFGNQFHYRNFDLDIFTQFSKQEMAGGLVSPGTLSNNFVTALGRWQQAGQETMVPKASITSSSVYRTSSANFFDASYFRIKNVALSYLFPSTALKRLHIDQLKVYLQGQNLLSIWNRDHAFYDPETGANGIVPPLRAISLGVQIQL